MKKIIKTLLITSLISAFNLQTNSSMIIGPNAVPGTSFLNGIKSFFTNGAQLATHNTAPAAQSAIQAAVKESTGEAPSSNFSLSLPTNESIINAGRGLVNQGKSLGNNIGNVIKATTQNKEIATGALLFAAYQSGLLNRAANLISFFQYDKMRDYPAAIQGEYLIYLTFQNENNDSITIESSFKNNTLNDLIVKYNSSEITDSEEKQRKSNDILTEINHKSSPINFLTNAIQSCTSRINMPINLIINVGLTLQGNWFNRMTRRWLKPVSLLIPNNINSEIFEKDLYVSHLKDMTQPKTFTTNLSNDTDYYKILNVFYNPEPIYHITPTQNKSFSNYLYPQNSKFSGTYTEMQEYINDQIQKGPFSFNIELEFIPTIVEAANYNLNEKGFDAYIKAITSLPVRFQRASTFYTLPTSYSVSTDQSSNRQYLTDIYQVKDTIKSSYIPSLKVASSSIQEIKKPFFDNLPNQITSSKNPTDTNSTEEAELTFF